MTYEANTGLGVSNQYGVRATGGAVGLEHGENSVKRLRIELTGDSINDAVAGFVPPVKVPKGANFSSYILRVDEAFVVTGTTPTILIGSSGSVATNGVVLTEAELENVGTKELSTAGAGTWATDSTTGLTAAALVDIELEGDAAVARGSGKATLILEFVDVAKA